MGKVQKKTGKGRLDKYYKLAKEQGYRARSAFKLIQLNKKFAFLETARCTIDLCAAPGGWLQVASKYMPVNSVIIGVDLVPIKPIPRVITFASDITTPQCRNLIRGELKDWKADVVLHDGAPNVGTAWIQDAYSQSELVLMSLKLAVEFLAKGGTFVTKVFRSVDYNNLIWVFNQLFGKVEATKPPSSRNVSAEIFVVCRDFMAPKYIDPKFLDPRHVFKDIEPVENGMDKGSSSNNAQANVFQPEKKRRHRDGYADRDYTLFKSISAGEFIRGLDPVALLGVGNRISFDTEEEKEWLTFESTSSDVKANCEDLKVLGKGDFKTLLKWRLALRQELGLDNRTKDIEELTETVDIVETLDEEQEISKELDRLNAEAAARSKRERRRANEVKTRTIQRMQLQMTAPLDIGLEQQDDALGIGQDDMFDLGDAGDRLSKHGGISRLLDEDEDIDVMIDDGNDSSSDESDTFIDVAEEKEQRMKGLEAELDGLYDIYQERLRERDAKFRVTEARRKNAEREEWHGIQAHQSDDESVSEVGGWERARQIQNFEEESSSDEDASNGHEAIHKGATSVKRARSTNQQESKSSPVTSKVAQVWFSQEVFTGTKNIDEIDNHEEDDELDPMDVDEASSAHEDDFEVAPLAQNGDSEMWDVENEIEDDVRQAKIKNLGLTTLETVTMAQRLINRQTTKTQLINDGFNRYSLNSKEGLPSWFLDDESKFYKPNIPITKEAIAALREKQRALDARPIKKVAEAKARKKFKTQQRLEKAMKKAEGVNSTADMSEREKAQQIEKLMRKGMSSNKKTKKDIKLVVAKGAHKGIKGRPKGIKGRYTMVDSRMKKEIRAKRRTEKANRSRRRG